MNAAERNDWLTAVSECFPDWRAAGLTAQLERLDVVCVGGVWEAGACSRAGVPVAFLRWFGEGDGYVAWRRKAARVLDLHFDVAVEPGDGFPWLTLSWDTAADALSNAALPARTAGKRAAVYADAVEFKTERYSARMIGDPALSRVIDDFAAHAPIRDLVFQFRAGADGKRTPLPSWSIRLKMPLAWPALLRLDLAGAFATSAAQQSFFVLDRRVTELAFEGETLWAYFRR